MGGLKTSQDPAVLSFLLTEDLYAIEDANATGLQTHAGEPAQTGNSEQTQSRGHEPDATQESKREPVQGEPMNEPVPAREDTVFHYLGENRKFVLVLVDYPEEDYMPAAEKDYLEKVLASVKIAPDDIALLNYARYPGTAYQRLKDFFAFGHLLLFGVTPLSLKIPGPVLPYRLGLVEDVKILAADSTETLRPDNAKKRALWEELKRTFTT